MKYALTYQLEENMLHHTVCDMANIKFYFYVLTLTANGTLKAL